MKVLAINGSPRPGGNTESLLKQVLEPLEAAHWDTEYLRIGGKPLRGCIACMQCLKKQDRRCGLGNDGLNDYVERMFQADAIVLGSPTYFGNITSELKALIDRAGFVALANGGAFSGKIGAGVVAARRGGAINAFHAINNLFLISSMVVPGSLYWNLGAGCEKGEVENDEEARQNMQHLGEAIAWLGRAMESAAASAPFPKWAVELH